MNNCRIPRVYKTKDFTKTLRLRQKNKTLKNFKILTLDAVRSELQKSLVSFRKIYGKTYALLPGIPAKHSL